MPPPVLLDPASIDTSKIVADRDEIMRHNRQRYEFALLDAVVLFDAERGLVAGYHDVRPDAWWTRGHVPERALFPGVLMIEAAAQLASFAYHKLLQTDVFMGFAGVDGVKFRGTVEPPCRFLLIGLKKEARARRFISVVQGFVNNQMVFEGEITGMPL
jgi:3-hydroxyacyl-[acyl-carrier-protein] dehydratase